MLFIDEVAERPYRLDRMLTQLRFAGLLAARRPWCSASCRAATSLATAVRARARWSRICLSDFPGPVLFGLPSGHTNGACMTLPFGVRARVIGRSRAGARLEEAAVA